MMIDEALAEVVAQPPEKGQILQVTQFNLHLDD